MNSGLAFSVFPSTSLRVFSSVLHYLGSSILAFLFARRTVFEELTTFRGWQQLSFARLAVILVFADSWLFLVFTGILIHGVGLELNTTSCSLGIYACITLYSSSKVFIYLFLTEKVWIVWSSNTISTPTRRLRSPVYLLCCSAISLYTVCFVLLLIFHIAEMRVGDNKCVIGLRRPASLTLLTYDVFITLLLTSLFIYPLWKDRVLSPKLRRVAMRTLCSSFVALTTSAINIALLTMLGGRELGWVCLASCGGDVTINALVLYIITEGRTQREHQSARRPVVASFILPGLFDLNDSSQPSSGAVERRVHPHASFIRALELDPDTVTSTVSGFGLNEKRKDINDSDDVDVDVGVEDKGTDGLQQYDDAPMLSMLSSTPPSPSTSGNTPGATGMSSYDSTRLLLHDRPGQSTTYPSTRSYSNSHPSSRARTRSVPHLPLPSQPIASCSYAVTHSPSPPPSTSRTSISSDDSSSPTRDPPPRSTSDPIDFPSSLQLPPPKRTSAYPFEESRQAQSMSINRMIVEKPP